MKLTKKQKKALDFFALDFAESEEQGAGWFAYTTERTPDDYPLSSCECIEDVVTIYKKRLCEAANE